MSSSTEPFTLLWLRPLKPSHRSFAEQLVGLGIFLILNLGLQLFGGWAAESGRYFQLKQAPWAFEGWAFGSLWTLVTLCQTIGIWTLWRRHSLKTLKLELSLYSSQALLVLLWSLSFFVWQQMLLGLVVLLLELTAVLLSTIVFWKKERLSGVSMLPLLAWGIFIGSLNMAICLLNP